MLAKKNRLNLSKIENKTLFQRGEYYFIKGNYFNCHLQKQLNQNRLQISVVISRSVAKTAVVKNRRRRQAQELLKSALSDLKPELTELLKKIKVVLILVKNPPELRQTAVNDLNRILIKASSYDG